jgi:HlyD family secretion protein
MSYPTRLTALCLPLVIELALAGCSRGPQTEVVTPTHGEFREWFSEPARTRLSRDYRISMPVDGRIGRITLEPGDRVKAEQILVPFDREPLAQAVTEARAAVAELEQQLTVNQYDDIENTLTVETTATISAARDALSAADAQVEAEQARVDSATKDLGHLQRLAAHGNAPQQKLDDAALLAQTSVIDLRQQELYRAALNTIFTAIKLGPEYVQEWLGRKRLEGTVITHQLEQARARLARAEHDEALAQVRSPVDGVVLERFEQGDSAVAAGTPLLLIGNLDDMEVIAEVLTQDALRLAPGAAVELTAATHPQPISGKVKRIDPAGFTKVSSLGVEQQRVNVIVTLGEHPADLGVGYQLQARFYTGIAPNALSVPRFSVLQAPDQSYYVLKVVDGKLQRQSVTLGLRNDLRLQLVSGLSDDARIVAAPDTSLREGQPIEAARK